MCHYRYMYWSACQHGELYRLSYCNKAKELGVHLVHGRTRPEGDNNTAIRPPDLPSPQQQASSHHNNSPSHSHSQQHNPNMSTLTRSEAVASFTPDATLEPQVQYLTHDDTDLSPRSPFKEHVHSEQHPAIYEASPLLDIQGGHNLNIDQPVANQCFTPFGVTHTVQAAGTYRTRASSIPSRNNHAQHASTVQGASSSRKPIPAHWMSSQSGPNLATAQRAKERGHKKASAGNSPVETKTLRGTRSSMDIGRSPGFEAPTFLTKEALAAVDSSIASPKSARSPTRQKLTLKTPATSPVRSSQRPKTALGSKLSPSKVNRPEADLALFVHSRGPSSVATSTGDTVYHDIEESPVMRTSNSVTPTMEKPVTSSTISSRRPRLSVQIPPTMTHLHVHASSSATSNSATNSAGSFSPSPSISTSRIPRAAVNTMESACGPARSSTLKQAQSKESKKYLKGAKPQSDQQREPLSANDSRSISTAPTRRVRTVDSAGATPILLRNDEMSSRYVSRGTEAGEPTAESPSEHMPKGKYRLEVTPSNMQDDLVVSQGNHAIVQASRASSASTVKASIKVDDPAILDTAVIHSRMKSDASGTFHKKDDASPMATDQNSALSHSLSTSRNRSEQHSNQNARKSSIRSAHSSDLRPTAVDFVPQALQSSDMTSAEAGFAPQATTSSELTLPKLEELDMYGIPWYYYMCQMQFAYNEGYHYGRSKSPKKFRPRKQRPAREAGHVAGPAGPSHPAGQSQRALGAPEAQGQSSLHMAAKQAQPQPKKTTIEQLEAESTGDERSASPFADQMALISRQAPRSELANLQRPGQVDITTIRNVDLPYVPRAMRSQPGSSSPHNSNNLLQYRNPGFVPNRRNFNRNDNGLYTHNTRGMAGYPIDALAFPSPIAPQGRPSYEEQHGSVTYGRASAGPMNFQYQNFVGSEACGMVNIVAASERIGGPPCDACYPDHPMG